MLRKLPLQDKISWHVPRDLPQLTCDRPVGREYCRYTLGYRCLAAAWGAVEEHTTDGCHAKVTEEGGGGAEGDPHPALNESNEEGSDELTSATPS